MQRLRNTPDGAFRPRFTRVEEQCAVLIGGFKDMELANRALPEVKRLPCAKSRLPVRGGRQRPDAHGREASYRERRQEGSDLPAVQRPPAKVEQVVLNPFVRSFVIHNPAAPARAGGPVEGGRFILEGAERP